MDTVSPTLEPGAVLAELKESATWALA